MVGGYVLLFRDQAVTRAGLAGDKLERMSPAAHRLIEEALALPEDARTELLEALIESLDGPAEARTR